MSNRKVWYRLAISIIAILAITSLLSATAYLKNANSQPQLGRAKNTSGFVSPGERINIPFAGPCSGTKNIPGDYADLATAIADINTNGVLGGGGGCTLNLVAANPQTAPAGGYSITTATSTASDQLMILGNGNTITAFSPQATGSNSDAIFKIVGSDFVTIQNFTMNENAGNTVTTPGATNTMTEFGVELIGAGINGAQNNTIQNNVISLNGAYSNSIGILSSAASAGNTAGTNSNNKIYGNTISNVAQGIWFIAVLGAAGKFETGNDIGGSAIGTGNTITFGNAAASTSLETNVQAGILYRNGAGNNIRFNTVTSNSAAYVGSAGLNGIMIRSGAAPTGVTYTSTISDNTVNITSTGVDLLTGIDFGQGIANGTIVGSNNNVTVTQTASADDAANAIGIKADYPSATNTCNSNAVVLNISESSGNLSGPATGMTLAGASTTITANSNNITINQTGSGTGTFNGIASATTALSVAGPSSSSINALTNTILINQTTSVAFGFGIGGLVRSGILANAVAPTVNVMTNAITVKQAVTGAGTYGDNVIKYIDVNAASGTINVKGNNLNTTGSTLRSIGTVVGVLQDSTVTQLVDIQNNTMNVDRVAAGGSIIFQSTSGGSNEVRDTVSNNNITFTNLAGSTTATAISSLGGDATVANNKSINNNTISISGTHAGTTIGITCANANTGFIQDNSITVTSASATVSGITTSGQNMISGNTLSLTSSSTVPTAMQGINDTNLGQPRSITNNTISAMNLTGIITTSPTVSGIASGVSQSPVSVSGNTITNISVGAATSSGSPIVDGILISGGAISVFKNKIHGLTTGATGTSTLLSGLRIPPGGGANETYNVYNNIIGNLSAPGAVSSGTFPNDSIRGINLAATFNGTYNVFYNTVYLNASSTGANFGTTGIFHTSDTTSTNETLNLRNNIIDNRSTPNGTGQTVVYRRSGGAAGNLANYAGTSNNNDFFLGTAGANKFIYADGTSTAATIADYKAGIFTAGTIAPRDSASISEDAEYQSTIGSDPNFLKYRVNVGKQIESGAVNIPGITDDYFGTVRFGNGGYAPCSPAGSAPDIGAWELCGIVAPTAASSSISGIVTRADGQPLGGVTVNLGGSESARTITNSSGFYQFSNVETSAFYTVTPGLANYSFSPSSRSFSLLGNRTDATFTGTANSSATENPLNVGDFFVRQQYLDFLGREPDQQGWLFWTEQLTRCGQDTNCVRQKRIDISAAFFISDEFQKSGNYVYRLYRAALGRQLTYAEFTDDHKKVIGGADLESLRTQFVDDFVQRPEFIAKYENTVLGETFVDAVLQGMLADTHVDLSSQREALIATYNSGGDLNHSRSAVLQAVAERSEFKNAVYNPSFVLMEYFGYLQRDIDQDGFDFWMNVLTIRTPGNYRGMVCSFITSAEYQQRFSPVVTHSNAECGR